MKTRRILSIVIALLSCLLAVGVKTFFAPCGVHDDGAFSTCHWAGQAVLGLGIVLAIQAVLAVIAAQEKTAGGIALAMIPEALLAALLPGHLIDLCMMETMRCHTIMKPAVLVIGVVIALCSAVLAVVCRKQKA